MINELFIEKLIGAIAHQYAAFTTLYYDVLGDDVQMRLVDGEHQGEGHLQVLRAGVWGTVCDDDFNDNTGEALCRMLGYRLDIEFYGNNLIVII